MTITPKDLNSLSLSELTIHEMVAWQLHEQDMTHNEFHTLYLANNVATDRMPFYNIVYTKLRDIQYTKIFHEPQFKIIRNDKANETK